MIQLWFAWLDSMRLDQSCYPRPRQRKRSDTMSTPRLAGLLGIHRSESSPGHNRLEPEQAEPQHPGPAHPEQHRLARRSSGHVHAERRLWPLQRPQGKSAPTSGSWTRALAPLKSALYAIMRGFCFISQRISLYPRYKSDLVSLLPQRRGVSRHGQLTCSSR